MHAKTATLACLALITASYAAPLSDRLSWSYVNHGAVAHRRSEAVCNGTPVFGLDSGRTEGDCAKEPNVTGFRAGSLKSRSTCIIPVAGSTKRGTCYVGGSVAVHRSMEEDDGAAVTEDAAQEGDKEPGEKEHSPEGQSLPEQEPAPKKQSPCSEEGSTTGDGKPPAADVPPQSPVQAPKPTPTQTSTSVHPSITDKPGPPNAQTPHHPKPPANASGEDKSLAWLGTAIFKTLGGLF